MSLSRHAPRIVLWTREQLQVTIEYSAEYVTAVKVILGLSRHSDRVCEFRGIYGEPVFVKAGEIVCAVIWDPKSHETWLEDERYASQERIGEEGYQ